MTMIEYARDYASRGWAVLPLHWIENGQCSCGKPKCSSAGKHPLVEGGFKAATTHPQITTDWWTTYPKANIGIATGKTSGLIVIDIDDGAGKVGFESLAILEEKHGKIPDKACVRTGGGGLHFYLEAPEEEIPSSAGKIAGNVDIRGENGYVVAPPSIHASGNQYAWGRFNAR